MVNYDLNKALSPIDFELLSKDILEAELKVPFENFSEGRDQGIDLRYAQQKTLTQIRSLNFAFSKNASNYPAIIVQCKRHKSYASLKSELEKKELEKIKKLNPQRYILTTSVSLNPMQTNEIQRILSPYITTTGDIYGLDRLNSLLSKHPEVERRHTKLWAGSVGVIESIINAGSHAVSREELERTQRAAKLYVKNKSFDEAIDILKKHRVCIISGQPGIGKTTLARMLLLYFYNRNFDIVKIDGDISEARRADYHQKPKFYYYDDFLGQTSHADKLNKNEDQKILDFMASVRESKDSVFVLTTREYILNQARIYYEKLARQKFDHETCVIDLTKYSRRIKAQILYNHLYFSDLPKEYLHNVTLSRGYAKIIDHKNYNPRLIEYLTSKAWIGDDSPQNYLNVFIGNLDNPAKIWDHAFRHQLSNKAQHLLFVLTTMPSDVMDDLETAFTAFHTSLCKKHSSPSTPHDFKDSLKELDGTFVHTQKVQGRIVLRFQNPSIRDFMKNIVASGEYLSDILSSVQYFEQAVSCYWLLRDKNTTQNPLVKSKHSPAVRDALILCCNSKSCSFHLEGLPNHGRIFEHPIDFPERLATTAKAVAELKTKKSEKWMNSKLNDISADLLEGCISRPSVVASLKAIQDAGFLGNRTGKKLIAALKRSLLDANEDIDNFEAIANLVKFSPHLFSESEMEKISESFSTYAWEYANDYTSDNPTELQEEASRIGTIGSLLEVDTDEEQKVFRKMVEKIESEQESRWEDDDERRGGESNEDYFPDSALDSMFGTLNS